MAKNTVVFDAERIKDTINENVYSSKEASSILENIRHWITL